MEGLLVFGAILAVVWVIATPILVIAHFALRNRVAKVESELNSLSLRLSTGASDAPKAKAPPPAQARQQQEPEVSKPPESPPRPAGATDQAEGTPVAPPPAEPPVAEPPMPRPPKGPGHFEQFIAWFKENWVLGIGAVSLALAGIFLVQYGAERGLLTPFARVMSALAFGIALIGGGEFLRRRFGDEGDGAERFIPAALSGAGFLTLFAAVLAARGLYDLIGVTPAFGALAIISAAAVGFGWFYGPVLACVGVIGAIAAPYLVGGQTDTPWVLSCSIPDDHIDPRRSALFMARSILNEVRDGRSAC